MTSSFMMSARLHTASTMSADVLLRCPLLRRGNRWSRERVTSLRSHHKIPVYNPAEDGLEPWLNLNEAAAAVGVAPRTLRLAAERGEIDAAHPLADGPWLFRRADLDGPAGQALALRVQSGRTPPVVPDFAQQNLFSSTT